MKNTFTIIICLSVIALTKTSLIGENLKTEFLGAGFIGLLYVLADYIAYIIGNWGRFILICKCLLLSVKKEYIRFSLSYQYIIKVDDKYLLVKNSNWNFYQPVGGKYKRYPQTQTILNKFGAKDDLKLETTGLKKDDFALFVPAKNAIKFLDWFNSGNEREVSHWREFYEELIEGKGSVLSKDNFPNIDYLFLGKVITPLKKSPNLKCWEILQYDILEFLPNEDQKEELYQLLKAGDNDYIKWADYKLIKNDGHNNHLKRTPYKIGEHTKWVIDQTWSKI